jgi:hypothetical protein
MNIAHNTEISGDRHVDVTRDRKFNSTKKECGKSVGV